MAAKQGAERFKDTLDFMEANGARALSQRIDMAMTDMKRRTDAGDAIKMDYWIKSDTDRALQAIMLCRYMFVEKKYLGEITNWGEVAMGTKQQMQTHWRPKSVTLIMDGVTAYDRLANPTCMAAALERLGRTPSRTDFVYSALTRKQNGIGTKAAICYQTVTLALFMAGHVSIPWLAEWYSASNAGNCFDLMGKGTEVPTIDAVRNLRGTIVSFRNKTKMGPHYVNHWAVVIGNGRAIGSNTDGFVNASSANASSPAFVWGDRNFHEFDLDECYNACASNTKYKDTGGVRVATHDPSVMKVW